MQPEDDELPPLTAIDLVFEALARLAGTCEAEANLGRSAGATPGGAKKRRHEKKSSAPLVVRNDNTDLSVVAKRTRRGEQT